MSPKKPSRRGAGALRRLRMAPDTKSRHGQISALAGDPDTLLDVGGEAGDLALFLPRSHVITANIEPGADVLFDGFSLPFGDDAFDVAVSVDVIEHIERAQRARHVADLARVAREKVIVCCPLGGEAHDAAERELAAWHESVTGHRHRFLDEHLERGLPTADELAAVAAASLGRFELLFAGDFRDSNAAFRAATELKAAPTPRRLLRYLRAARRTADAAPPQPAAGPHTNRAFIVGAPGLGATPPSGLP